MAEQAVVGVLKAVMVAENDKFDASMKKSATVAQTTEKAVASLGQEVARFTPQADRMVKAFQGDKLLYQANSLTAAVQKLGGAQKLTETEQARVNATLTQAIAKYKALGQEAPKALLDLESATRKVVTQSDNLSRKLTEQSTAASKSGVALESLTMAAARYISGAAIGGAILTTLKYAESLDKSATALGASATATQRLENIAVSSNTTLEAMTASITMMQDRLAGGDKSAVAALDRLGLSVEQVFALNPDQQFLLIAKALQQIHSDEQQIQLAKDIFGRGAVEIIGAVRGEVDHLAESVRKLSPEQLKALADAEDAWDRLWLAAKRYSGTVISIFADPFGSHQASMGPFAPVINPDLPRSPAAARRMPAPLSSQAFLPGDAEQMMDRAARSVKKAHDEASKLLVTQERMNGLAFTYAKYLELWAPAIENANVSAEQLTNFASHMAELTQATPGWMDSEHISDQVSEVEVELSRLAQAVNRDVDSMVLDVSDGFADMLVRARSFKDGFLDIWHSIQHGIANILGDILNNTFGNFLRQMTGRLAGAAFGQAAANAVMGTAAGAALGGGAAAMTVDTLPGAAAGGGAAGGAGFLTNPAFWTNPWTIGAAATAGVLTWGIAKKGWFRGGEEGVQVNPKRDQFFEQFVERFGGTPYSAILRAYNKARVPGDLAASQISALYDAHSVDAWRRAEGMSADTLAAGGVRGVKLFPVGGFVPPNTVQPAILHGGGMGELAAPINTIAKMIADRQAATGHVPRVVQYIDMKVEGLLSVDTAEEFRRKVLVPLDNRARLLNTDYINDPRGGR